jgi:hypothetical protein
MVLLKNNFNEIIVKLLEMKSLNRRIIFGYNEDFKDWLRSQNVEDVSNLIHSNFKFIWLVLSEIYVYKRIIVLENFEIVFFLFNDLLSEFNIDKSFKIELYAWSSFLIRKRMIALDHIWHFNKISYLNLTLTKALRLSCTLDHPFWFVKEW